MWTIMNRTLGEVVPIDASRSVVDPAKKFESEVDALLAAAEKNRLRADRLIRISRDQSLKAERLQRKGNN